MIGKRHLALGLPRGPSLLVYGVLTGLAFPSLAGLVRPAMPVTVFVFVLGTFLVVDGQEFREALARTRVSIVLPVMAMVICPAAIGLILWSLSLRGDLAAALVLAACAPPSSGTAAVARILGLKPSVPLAVTLLSIALTPLTLPLMAHRVAGVSLDPWALVEKVLLLIGSAAAVAVALRHYASPQLTRYSRGINRSVLGALVLFSVATMAGVRHQIETRPLLSLYCVGLAFACNLAMQAVGGLVLSGSFSERLTHGLILGNRNVGLIWSVLGSTLSPTATLFFAATQIPIYTMPRLIEIYMQISARRRVHPTIGHIHTACRDCPETNDPAA